MFCYAYHKPAADNWLIKMTPDITCQAVHSVNIVSCVFSSGVLILSVNIYRPLTKLEIVEHFNTVTNSVTLELVT